MREEAKISGYVFLFLVLFVGGAIVVGDIEGTFTVTVLLNGLQAAGVLVLLALGLTLIFGMAGVINFAHGALFLIGAYTTWVVTDMGVGYLPAVLVALIATGLFGFLVEVIGLRRLYEKDILLQVLYTFGIAVGIQGLMLFLIGPSPRSVKQPPWGSGFVNLGVVEYPTFRLLIILVTVLLLIGVWLALYRTNIGLIIRAGTRDAEMVRVLGIDIQQMYTLVFVFGSVLAGLAGALAIPVQSVTPLSGNDVVIDSFVVVVIGGMGSILGTVLGGLSVAQIQTFSGFIPILRTYADPAIFLFMALVLLIRPRGLLGTIGLFEE
jgi:branched-chain amino acid transport system permease protein